MSLLSVFLFCCCQLAFVCYSKHPSSSHALFLHISKMHCHAFSLSCIAMHFLVTHLYELPHHELSQFPAIHIDCVAACFTYMCICILRWLHIVYVSTCASLTCVHTLLACTLHAFPRMLYLHVFMHLTGGYTLYALQHTLLTCVHSCYTHFLRHCMLYLLVYMYS